MNVITSPTSALPVTLGPVTQIQAPQENVAQFQALLNGVTKAMQTGKGSLTENLNPPNEWTGATLLEDTALRVSLAEKGVARLEREIHVNSLEAETQHNLEGDFPQSIIQMKHATSHYFLALQRVGSGAQDFAEEVQSLTRGR